MKVKCSLIFNQTKCRHRVLHIIWVTHRYMTRGEKMNLKHVIYKPDMPNICWLKIFFASFFLFHWIVTWSSVFQSNQTSAQRFIWIIQIKIQNGDHTERRIVGTLGRKIGSGVSHSRESLLLRRVAALRLRAKKDSVGVMSRSTIRLSHGLRRRLRADTRGRRQLLSQHTGTHRCSTQTSQHKPSHLLHTVTQVNTHTHTHTHSRRWFGPAAHPHKHTRTHTPWTHCRRLMQSGVFYAAFMSCRKHLHSELNSPKVGYESTKEDKTLLLSEVNKHCCLVFIHPDKQTLIPSSNKEAACVSWGLSFLTK